MLRKMGVYSLTALPAGRKAIGNRWVFEYKVTDAGNVAKGHVVALGFNQNTGIDFNKTFAPVAKAASTRLLAAIACKEGWELDCFDATRAFLWGNLEEEIYMLVPDGFCSPKDEMDKLGKGTVMHLHKSICGLKQASQVWYQKFSGVLTSLGLQKSLSDNAMFHFKGTWRNQPIHCILVIHVDDGMGGCNSVEYLAFLKAGILQEFSLKDLGPVKCFLGVQFECSRAMNELWIHQRDYIEALLTDYGLQDCSPVSTPMDHSLPFGDLDDAALSEPYPVTEYQGMMGRLSFLCLFSRPEFNYPVNRLTQFNSCPQVRHALAAKRILRYLAGT